MAIPGAGDVASIVLADVERPAAGMLARQRASAPPESAHIINLGTVGLEIIDEGLEAVPVAGGNRGGGSRLS